MGLYEKIEEIRKQPEHIRMRYVWVMVTISMVFVLIIWFVSFKTGLDNDSLLPSDVTNSDIVSQFNEQRDSLKNTTDSLKGAIDQQSQQQNLNNNQ